MREEREGMQYFHLKPPKSQPLYPETNSLRKALSFHGFGGFVSFDETMEPGISHLGYFSFPVLNLKAYSLFPPERVMSSLS